MDETQPGLLGTHGVVGCVCVQTSQLAMTDSCAEGLDALNRSLGPWGAPGWEEEASLAEVAFERSPRGWKGYTPSGRP